MSMTLTEQKAINSYNSKTMKEIYKGVPDAGLRLLSLMELVPNWETYLTSKQLEAAECYVKCLNASEVDYQLNVNVGTTQQRLFGSSTSKGALGRLEEIVSRLQSQGYYEKRKKDNINNETKKAVKASRLSDEVKSQVRELLKLIADMPEYENYLTETQKERIYQFLRLRSFKACAKYFNITEVTFKQSLLGRGGKGGILGRLNEAYVNKTVSNWEDI